MRLSLDEGAKAHTLILSGGRIEFVLDAEAELPAGVHVIDGEGLFATSALIDAYSTAGCETPEPKVDRDLPPDTGANVLIDMREANRKGIQPAFAAAQVLELADDDGSAYREKGFGLYLASPHGQLLSGRSALASTRQAAARQQVILSEVFDHAAFDASGDGYPSTLMGYMAQLRQFFYDAQRHRELRQRLQDGKPGPLPAFDEDLDAGTELLAGKRRLVCEAESARDIRRWMRLADEFDLKIAISGGREAWKVADALASRGIPVLLTLDWGKEVEDPDKKPDKEKGKGKGKGKKRGEGAESEEPEGDASGEDDAAQIEEVAGVAETSEEVVATKVASEPDLADADKADADDAEAGEADAEKAEADEQAEEKRAEEAAWTYEEPLGVKREKRRLWEESRDCAIRLQEAGVRFAFGSGKEAAKDLREHVSQLVEAGLSADVALSAMTRVPAELLGVGSHYGRVEAGFAADLALWTADPTAKDTQLAYLVVDGFPQEFELKAKGAETSEGPAEGLELSGRWSVETSSEDEKEPAVLELKMSAEGKLSGTIQFKSPMDGSSVTQDIEGQVSGRSVELISHFTLSSFEIELSFSGKVEQDGESISGSRSVSGPGFSETDDFSARRGPGSARAHTGLGAHLAQLFARGEAQAQRSGTGAEAGAPLGLPTGRSALESRCGCDQIGQGHSDHDEGDEQ